MANYYMITNNQVESIIVADDKEATEAALRCTLIEITPENPAGTGWTYDPETGIFSAPEVEEDLTVEPTMEETDANAQ